MCFKLEQFSLQCAQAFDIREYCSIAAYTVCGVRLSVVSENNIWYNLAIGYSVVFPWCSCFVTLLAKRKTCSLNSYTVFSFQCDKI